MAEDGMLKLTVKSLSSQQDAFEVEIPEDETVESLVVIIFSLRHDLGEELRICHRQRALKPEAVLKDAGVRSGDSVVVARRPKPTRALSAPATSLEATAPVAKPVEPSLVGDAVPLTFAPPERQRQQEEPCLPGHCPPSYWLALHARFANTPLAVSTAASAAHETSAATPAYLGTSTHEVVADEATPMPATPAAEEDVVLPPLPEDGPPSATLEELAHRIEAGLADAHPGELAAVLRRTATRVKALEGGMGEMGHMMEMLHLLSGRALQAFGGPSSEGGGLTQAQPAQQREEEAPRSFLVKKGDADVQEHHRLATAQRPSQMIRQTSGGAAAGGTLSSSSAPMSKEEMDKARRARLERLEAQQAEKRREQEEAELKAKSRDAMFNSLQVGSAKPLGKH